MTQYETDYSGDSTPALAEVPGRLKEMISDGLVSIDAGHLKVTEAGKPFVRNVCMALDARLARQAPDRQVFSRTV
jgi:oxygen-independent coproporphyrinogen-3 oxidase